MKFRRIRRRVHSQIVLLAWGPQAALILFVILVFVLFEKMSYSDTQLRRDKALFEERVRSNILPDASSLATEGVVLPPRIVEPNPDTHPVLSAYSEDGK